VRLAIVTPATARARAVLGRLPAAQRRALLANARLREPDAAAVIKRVADKTADAGIVFGSDHAKAHAATGLDTDPPTYVVGLPGYLQLPFAKSVAIVNGTKNQLAANAFIYGLIDINSGAYYALSGSGFTPDPPIAHRPPKPAPVKQGDV
jgi:ABC-type molybdate transport system substrate-binding protein